MTARALLSDKFSPLWLAVRTIVGDETDRLIAPRAQQGEGAARLRAAPARARRGRLSIFD